MSFLILSRCFLVKSNKMKELNFTPYAAAKGSFCNVYLLINKTIEKQNIQPETNTVRLIIYNTGQTTIFNEEEKRLGNYLSFGYYPISFEDEKSKKEAMKQIADNCSEGELEIICDSLK